MDSSGWSSSLSFAFMGSSAGVWQLSGWAGGCGLHWLGEAGWLVGRGSDGGAVVCESGVGGGEGGYARGEWVGETEWDGLGDEGMDACGDCESLDVALLGRLRGLAAGQVQRFAQPVHDDVPLPDQAGRGHGDPVCAQQGQRQSPQRMPLPGSLMGERRRRSALEGILPEKWCIPNSVQGSDRAIEHPLQPPTSSSSCSVFRGRPRVGVVGTGGCGGGSVVVWLEGREGGVSGVGGGGDCWGLCRVAGGVSGVGGMGGGLFVWGLSACVWLLVGVGVCWGVVFIGVVTGAIGAVVRRISCMADVCRMC